MTTPAGDGDGAGVEGVLGQPDVDGLVGAVRSAPTGLQAASFDARMRSPTRSPSPIPSPTPEPEPSSIVADGATVVVVATGGGAEEDDGDADEQRRGG